MRYYALATDYDGTLAHHGKVSAETRAALVRLRHSGRRLILVTGREINDLWGVFPDLHLFERVIAENGAVLYDPARREERLLAEPPPPAFVERLQANGVEPLSVGRVIVATWEPHEATILAAIRDLGLEHQVIFNKGAVMVLPSGVNKATGLTAALKEIGLSAHNTVAVGDAENDHALLRSCECAVAVNNALSSVKEKADWVTGADHGDGVRELADRLLETDLGDLSARLHRHDVVLGYTKMGEPVTLPSYGATVLLAGTSGGGKSTFATGLLERLAERNYQFCVIDPEGDYQNLDLVTFGGVDHAPDITQVATLLENPDESVVVNLVGVAHEDRPAFFDKLLASIAALRARSGRPHWVIMDEAHHLVPSTWQPTAQTTPVEFKGALFITIHPHHMAPATLASVDTVIVIGGTPAETLGTVAKALGENIAIPFSEPLTLGQAVLWRRHVQTNPVLFDSIPPSRERQRHQRKYAIGELPPDRSFYFRGPHARLNLRAQNLSVFLQSADGVDDETWLYHLRRGDYSRWFQDVIKDPGLAERVRRIEQVENPTPPETRAQVREQIERRYTAPA